MQKILLLMGTMIVSHAFSAHAEDTASPSYVAAEKTGECPDGYSKESYFPSFPNKPCAMSNTLLGVMPPSS